MWIRVLQKTMQSAIALATVAVLCVVQCQSPTPTTTTTRQWTHGLHTHPTHLFHGNQNNHNLGKTDEMERYTFHLDKKTHSLVVALDHDCYVMPLSDIQKSKVNDPNGLVIVEADALQMIADNQLKTDLSQDTKEYYYKQGHCHAATTVVMLVDQ